MFAFAIWDNEERKLTLARDRFGVKPLYYAQVGHAFVFASEHKASRALADYLPRVDVRGLSEYLTFQNFRLIRDISQRIDDAEPIKASGGRGKNRLNCSASDRSRRVKISR
jgi:asparagine synthetase B (glutamine-hydrolysing)